MKESTPGVEDCTDEQLIEDIYQLKWKGLVKCQLCGSPFAAGDAVSVYAYRPAGESCFEVGHVICGGDAHTLPSYFTLGVRELILEGRVGVVVDVANLPDTGTVHHLVNLCGLEHLAPAAAEPSEPSAPQDTDAATPSKATEALSAAGEPTEPSAPKVAEEAEEPKFLTAADESTTTNSGAAAELVFVDPAVRAVSGAETTTARFRPPADATSLHLHSNSPSGAGCCVDDPDTDDANLRRNTDSNPRESVSWVYGETMRERAREHEDGLTNGAGTNPQPASEEPSTPSTGRTDGDTRGGEF